MKTFTQNFESLKSQFTKNAELERNFPKEIFAETQKFSKETFAKSNNREDFRHLHIVCIDPQGARDHDDAISIEKTNSGYILGVHIADVSHFVKPHSALDTEAKKRAYTQYLPWGSFPMLPEILSGDLCSLKENEPRFSFSCIISLDKKCRMLKYRFTKGLIKVSRSITYEQAVKLFEKKDGNICLLAHVASNLKKVRNENGILEMDSAEYQCQFNKKGEPLRIAPRETCASNSWIEECMLAANKCCALELQKRKLNGIYRTHEAPDPEDIAMLIKDEPNLFFDSSVDPHKLLKHYKGDNSQDKRIFELYAGIVKKAKGKPLLTNKILRSMQKARYSADCSGHFALHWKNYAHFTSPIRRYADLWCHRELSKSGKVADLSHIKDELCTHLNEAEFKNQKTERKALKLCTSYLLQNQIGQTFNAEIQGIEEFGVFISVSNSNVALADGLVHLRDIPGDFYIYNEERDVLIGKRSGKKFKRGDKLTVKLTRVNPLKGENDFEVILKHASKQEHKQEHKQSHKQKKRRFGR